MSDESARKTVFNSAEEAAEEMSTRFENRQCMICGANSGNEPMLPPGWSYLVWGEKCKGAPTGMPAAFYCDECTKSLNMPENRNYGEDLN